MPNSAFAHLSRRVLAIKEGAVLAMMARVSELEREGRDIIRLGVGEPDFEAPPVVATEVSRILKRHNMKYSSAYGTLELREEIAKKMARENELIFSPAEICVTPGSNQGAFNLVMAVINPGDEFLIPAPYWTPYPEVVQLAGGVPVILHTSEESQLKVTARQIAEAITPRTKGLFLNSPSNPGGAVYSAKELLEIAEVLRNFPQIVIASDDIYEHFVYGDQLFCNILNVAPWLRERTVIMNGVSKTYAMTGWRLGWSCGPSSIIKAMASIQAQITLTPSMPSQIAGEIALRECPRKFLKNSIREYEGKIQQVQQFFQELNGSHCNPVAGGFFVFPYVQPLIDQIHANGHIPDNTDTALVLWILEKAGVSLVPGSGFGTPGHIRISVAASQVQLTEALQRLTALFEWANN